MMMWMSVGPGENIRENIRMSANESLGHYKLKHHSLTKNFKIMRRKQTKLQLLQEI